MPNILDLSSKRCNNHCRFCTFTGRKPGNSTSIHVLKASLRRIDDKNKVIFRGVEPTLRHDIIEIITYAKQIGFKDIILESNGRMFYYKDFCKKLIDAEVTQFNIYLFGLDSGIHDYISNTPKSFEQTLQGIKNLKELGAKVKITIFINFQNHHQLNDHMNLVSELNPESVAILYIDSENRKINTVDIAFFRGAARDIYNFICSLKKRGIKVDVNNYPESVDFTTLFDGITVRYNSKLK